MLELDAGALAEQFGDEMRLAGGARRRVIDLAGVCFGERDEFGERCSPRPGVDDEKKWIAPKTGAKDPLLTIGEVRKSALNAVQ